MCHEKLWYVLVFNDGLERLCLRPVRGIGRPLLIRTVLGGGGVWSDPLIILMEEIGKKKNSLV